MARFKHYSYEQTKMIPISFDQQIKPGSFEFALSYIVDNELDLSIFNNKFVSYNSGAPEYNPAIILYV